MVKDKDNGLLGGPAGGALLLCVELVHCWGLLGVSISVEHGYLSLLSIYHVRGFS